MLIPKDPKVHAQDFALRNDGSPPELGSVFIIRLLCGHACLEQRVHMFAAEPAHVLELAIVVHLPRISQCHLIDLCCKLSFFFLDWMSLEYSDTNQI